jgi:hypothetical protein
MLDFLKQIGSSFSPFAPFASAATSLFGGREQNVASAEAAQRQMQFQKEMSDTSFQRQVKDLEAAGINPMLVTKLGGASTPPGAMPSFVNPAAMAAQSFSAVQSSQAAKQQAETAERLSEAQVKNVEATTQKIISETRNLDSEEKRIWATTYMLNSQAEYMLQQGVTQNVIRDHFRAVISKLNAETKLLSNQAAVEAAMNDLGRMVGQGSKAAELLIQLIRGLK